MIPALCLLIGMGLGSGAVQAGASPPEDDSLEEEIRQVALAAGLDAEAIETLLTPTENGELPATTAQADEDGARSRARRRLRALAAALDRPRPEVSSASRALAAKILDSPEFRRTEGQETSMLSGVLEWWRALMGKLLLRLGRVVKIPAGLAMAGLVGVAMAVLVILAILISRGSLPALYRTARPAPPRDELREGDLALSLARRRIQSGHPVAGLRLLQKAAILTLQRRGALPQSPGLTDLESVRYLSGGDPSAATVAFGRLAELHDKAAYAGIRPSPEMIQEALELAEGLVRQEEARAA